MLRYSLYGQTCSFCRVYVWEILQGLEKWKSSPVVRYYEYDADRDLCICMTLDVHLERTKPLDNK